MSSTEFGLNSVRPARMAVADHPIEASVAARSELMEKLSALIRTQGWTQKEAAAMLGVTQPRISDLTRGKTDLFSLDTLIDMAAVAGMQPQIMLAPRIDY